MVQRPGRSGRSSCWLGAGLILLVGLLLATPAAGSNPNCQLDLPFCDLSLDFRDRAWDLAQRLTLDELAQQLNTYSFTPQAYAPGVPRLGLRNYSYHAEGLHGIRDANVVNYPATLYPQVTAMAATANASLIHEMSTIMGTELRAVNNRAQELGEIFGRGGALSIYGPTMNIIRDGRWGRSQESVSEDPWLNGLYAVNFVLGLEQRNSSKYLQAATSCKHLFAYSFEGYNNTLTRHSFNAVIDELDIHDTYLPAFRACVELGHVQQIMCSYNSVNGIPACARGDVQNDRVRKAWGFEGLIVSDCDAVADIYNTHNYTRTPEDAVTVALQGGCDLDCGDFYSQHLASAVQQNLTTLAALQQSMTRVLEMRFLLGEFDPDTSVPYRQLGREAIDTPFARDSSLRASRESVVLLENRIKLLPVTLSADIKVALIGPYVNLTTIMMGGKLDYTPSFITTYFQGFQAIGITHLTSSPGCNITAPLPGALDKAVQIATQADLVVLTLGLSSDIEHEGGDRETLGLPTPQQDLYDAISAAIPSSKLVVVLVNGGPVSVDRIKYGIARTPTIIEAFYGGQSAGTALAETIFGQNNPSGTLPYTVFFSNITAHVPFTDMHLRPDAATGFPGRTHRFFDAPVMWPFGHGLSYSTFSLAWQDETVPSITTGDFTQPTLMHQLLSVNVTNHGPLPGRRALHLYVTVPVTNVSVPLRNLVGLQKHWLAVDQSMTV
ncbi:uncharacterized protein MONBRDRAFT_15548 [Monosiga brevicollis MX1]|uniref:Fibronectin type III-like domain-containing protein n=1 Tax=Monosiga brevicollis TaxID=81824 RepID=A9UV64_MONBE|nr:uncharacterized protein MONBRDRAFT_15548 [Monosiga brevicollis MX1]EDQ91027.1 predicted protein [Monosiga brevicollis MX1]|eukprot:XP_001744324.1 hypothetical protein [Monosiga brevicollis MX1]